MEELIIQRNWDYTSSTAEANRKDRIVVSVIMVLLFAFAVLFTGYCIRKVHSFLYPQYNLEWQCQIPNIPNSMPVYEVTLFSSKEYLERNLKLADRIGAEYNHIYSNDKQGIYIDSDAENGVHLLIQNNETGEFQYHTRKHFWTGWKYADRTELEKKLTFYGISIPEIAQFHIDGNGWHTFTVASYFREGTVVAGEVRCRYAADGSIVTLENNLLEYTAAEYSPVVNTKTVRSELASGKYFRNAGFDRGANLKVVSAGLSYMPTKNNSCIPYCSFQIQQEDEPELITIRIPLLQKR